VVFSHGAEEEGQKPVARGVIRIQLNGPLELALGDVEVPVAEPLNGSHRRVPPNVIGSRALAAAVRPAASLL
jgi:hypothetical protein